MKTYFSSVKKIPIIELEDGIKINFTSDDPIKWIMVSAKIEDPKHGITDTLRCMVEPLKFKTGLKRDIKKKMDSNDLETISKLLKKYTKNGKLTQANAKELLKEIK